MNTNEAPEKLYIPFEDEIDRDCLNTYAQKNTYHKEIEYTRTNAFIEKARKWFEKQNEWFEPNGIRHCVLDDFKDFRKYMKGE